MSDNKPQEFNASDLAAIKQALSAVGKESGEDAANAMPMGAPKSAEDMLKSTEELFQAIQIAGPMHRDDKKLQEKISEIKASSASIIKKFYEKARSNTVHGQDRLKFVEGVRHFSEIIGKGEYQRMMQEMLIDDEILDTLIKCAEQEKQSGIQASL